MPATLRFPNLGINGYQGYAWVHREMAQAAERLGLCRYTGFADYGAIPAHDDLQGRFHVRDLGTLLTSLETPGLVMSPSPLHIHGRDHAEIIDAGHACYLEKPPTLDPEELETMLVHERVSPFPTAIGFQHMAGAERRLLKKRLTDGEFGPVKEVTFMGLWQRPRSYYTRGVWPGRLKIGQRLVLDSIFGNACSHFFHAALFWAGSDTFWKWAEASQVTASLFRVNEIQSADTLLAEATTTTGVQMRFAASHATEEAEITEERIVCALATITIEMGRRGRIEWVDGRSEPFHIDHGRLSPQSLINYLHHLQSPEIGPEIVRLEDCRSFVALNGLFYIASGEIHTIAAEIAQDRGDFLAIPGFHQAARNFIREGAWPTSAAWFRRPGEASSTSLSRLTKIVDDMETTADESVRRTAIK